MTNKTFDKSKRREKKMTPEEIERCIANGEASFAMEGLILDEEDKEYARKILNQEMTGDEAVAELKKKYGWGEKKDGE